MSGGNLDGLLSPFLRDRRLAAARPHIWGRVLDFGCGRADVCRFVGEDNYVGVDLDEAILAVARHAFPRATLLSPVEFTAWSGPSFDTIVALAVIEHLPEPVEFLESMKRHLDNAGRIVISTPAPSLDWIHGLGARMGVFASESHEEHQSLMNRRGLIRTAEAAGLRLVKYQRFLLGANQLAVLTH